MITGTLTILFVVLGVIMLIIIVLFYYWKMKAPPHLQPLTLVRRLSRSLSRPSGASPQSEQEHLTFAPSQTFACSTTITNLSDMPPSYADVRKSTSNVSVSVECPPSYHEAVTNLGNSSSSSNVEVIVHEDVQT